MNVVLTAINAKFIHSSLAVRSLHSYLEQAGTAAAILEMNINQPINWMTAQIVRAKPDLVGFSCYIWNWEIIKQVSADISKILPGVTIVLGGPEASYDSADHFQNLPWIDYIICGEGEKPLLQLIQVLQTGSIPAELQTVPGLAYVWDGQYRENSPHTMDLTSLPSPYSDAGMQNLANKVLYYESSRGCPYRCSYCLSSLSGPVREYPLQQVFSDLTKLLQLRPGQIRFVDRTFNANPARALAVIRWIQGQDTAARFHLEIKADLLQPELVEALSSGPEGRFQLEIGVQSNHAPTLAAVGRPTDRQKLQTNVMNLKKGAVPPGIMLDLIAGLPLETKARFAESFDYVYHMQPGKIHLGFLKLLRGSSLRDDAEKSGMLYQNHPPYEILRSPGMTYDELWHLHAIETIVDKYYNSGWFRWTLPWLQTRSKSPFQFYSEFASWWERQQLDGGDHGPGALYTLLGNYVQGWDNKDFIARLALDFRSNHRTAPLPAALQVPEAKPQLRRWMKESWPANSFGGQKPQQLRRFFQSLRLPRTVYGETDPDHLGSEQVVFFFYPQGRPPAEIWLPHQKEDLAPGSRT